MFENEFVKLFIRTKQLEQRMTKVFEERTGLSLSRYLVMLCIAEQNGIAPRAIQQQLQINKSAVTRHLQALEEKQLVSRDKNPTNQREISVHLTPEGQAQLDACANHEAEITTELLGAITPNQLDVLQATIQKLN